MAKPTKLKRGSKPNSTYIAPLTVDEINLVSEVGKQCGYDTVGRIARAMGANHEGTLELAFSEGKLNSRYVDGLREACNYDHRLDFLDDKRRLRLNGKPASELTVDQATRAIYDRLVQNVRGKYSKSGPAGRFFDEMGKSFSDMGLVNQLIIIDNLETASRRP